MMRFWPKHYRYDAFTWIFSVALNIASLFVLLISIFRKGKQVSWKNDPDPPICLNDPTYGTHGYIKLKDIKLHYVEAGSRDNPLIIFLHGFPDFWYSWRYQIKLFKNKFWTVAVDMRGYGRSDRPSGVDSYDDQLVADDVIHLIRALGRESCTLVAHDWGGLVGQLIVQRYPHMIDSFVLLNSPHPQVLFQRLRNSWKQCLKLWRVYFCLLPILPEFLLMNMDIFQLFVRLKKGSSTCDHDIDTYRYTYSSRDKWTGPLNYYRSIFSNQKRILDETNTKISIPTLLIWGSRDFMWDKEMAKLSAQYFSHCTLIHVKDGTHLVHQDSSAIVNQHIESFLKDLSKNCEASNGFARRVSKHFFNSMASSATKLTKLSVGQSVINLYNANNWIANLNKKIPL